MSHRWLCVLSLSLGLGCASWEAEHSVTIEAPPETVWKILIDLPSYAEWNSYSPSAVGSIREGGVVTIEARLGEEIRVVDNRVTRFDPERALCWHSMNWFVMSSFCLAPSAERCGCVVWGLITVIALRRV